MKKYFALIVSFILILTCFTACKPNLKNGAVLKDAGGKVYAAVTQENGAIVRDGAGNLVVLVTDKNGGNVKGDNDEYMTNAIALQHALVIGNRVECPRYSVTIPNGWSDKLSTLGLQIMKDGTKDIISITDSNKTTLDNEIANTKKYALDVIASEYSNSVTENKSITINENLSAQFMSAFVPDTGVRDEAGNIFASYLGYIFFEYNGFVFTCKITSNRDMAPYIDEIAEILSTIEFI